MCRVGVRRLFLAGSALISCRRAPASALARTSVQDARRPVAPSLRASLRSPFSLSPWLGEEGPTRAMRAIASNSLQARPLLLDSIARRRLLAAARAPAGRQRGGLFVSPSAEGLHGSGSVHHWHQPASGRFRFSDATARVCVANMGRCGSRHRRRQGPPCHTRPYGGVTAALLRAQLGQKVCSFDSGRVGEPGAAAGHQRLPLGPSGRCSQHCCRG